MRLRSGLALISALALLSNPALAQNGTEAPTGRAGADVADHVIFVKPRPAPVLHSVEELARMAGLEPVGVSSLSFFSPADDRRTAALMALPAQRRSAAAAYASVLAGVRELHYASDVDPFEAARRMMATGEVEYAEPIPLPHALGAAPAPPNDPMLDDQAHMRLTKAVETWEIFQGDTNTVVGIVDAGVDMFHEDLAPNIKENPGETGTDGSGNDKRTNGVDDDDNGVIDDWRGANLTAPDDGSQYGNTKGNSHGTAVSGSAAAATDNGIGVAGPALRCRFFPIKAQPTGMNTLTKGYQGIEYCGKRGFKVVNCSWGGPAYSKTLENFIGYVIARYDISVVAAAGNGLLYMPFYPAGYRNVLGVSASDTDDVVRTTWGEHVDVAAPVGLVTTEDNGYAYAPVATSFSSPVAAGVVAVARSRWPQLDAVQAIEHVRLTSDRMADLPDKQKLVGFGRVNELRAVTTDPFSHPAILVDTLWLTDAAGVPKVSFESGQTGRIMLRLRNVLGPARNVRVRIVAYAPEGNTIAIDTASIVLDSLATMAVDTLGAGFPFTLISSDSGRIRLRVEIAADGGYDDYRYEAPNFHVDIPEFILYFAPEVVFSLTYRGNLGFADYPKNEYGAGVQFREKQFLFEGGFMAAQTADLLESNVRGVDPDLEERDFALVERPGPGNDTTLVMSDSTTPDEQRIWLQLRIRGLVSTNVPNGFAVRAVVRNMSAAAIDSLRFAMFNDWDIGGEGSGQTVEYVTSPGAVVPFHGLTSGAGYVVASGVRGPARAPIFYALNNAAAPINIYDGFDRAEKWTTLSNGVGNPSAGPADVSLVMGRTITNLAVQAQDTVDFVFGFGASTDQAVAGMRAIAEETTAGVATPSPGLPFALGLPEPNPAPTSAAVLVSARPGSSLGLYDRLGRLVTDLTPRLSNEGVSTVRIGTSALRSGVYYLRLWTGAAMLTREMVVTH